MAAARIARSEPDYRCRDCGIDTNQIGEYSYMVLDVVWQMATERAQRVRGRGKASTYDLLCIGCLEDRLGCRLRPLDFKWRAPITWTRTAVRSKRLLLRLGNRLSREQAARVASDPSGPVLSQRLQ